MRILIVEPVGHTPGHHSYYARRLTEALLDQDEVEHVTVLSYAGFKDPWPARDGLTLLQVAPSNPDEAFAPFERPVQWREATAGVIPTVLDLAATHDVIQFLDCWSPTLAGALWRRRELCRKSVCLWHAPPVESELPRLWQLPRGLRTRWRVWRLRLLPEWLLMTRTHSLIHAQTVKDRILSVYRGAQATVIPPGIDACDRPLPSREEARQRLGLELGTARAILLFGFLGPHKGLDTFLSAMAQSPPEVRLLVAGPPKSDFDAVGLVQAAGWTDRAVVRLGYVPDDQVPLWFRAADAVLLAYPAFFIQNSGVLTRAADFLTPVIISDIGQMGELAREYGLGVLFTPEDPASLRQAVDRFLALDEAALAAMRAGLRRFAGDHSWPRIAAQHVAMYQRVMAGDKE
jgi:glycosyltransferase involved in cell wall biosynthesis